MTRTYPTTPPVHALRDCAVTVNPGDFVTVVGPSGSGKSTFLHIAGLLDRPTSGEYWLDGLNVSELSDFDRTAIRGRKIGFVFQAFQLLDHRTCLDNVMLSTLYSPVPTEQRRADAGRWLEAVGLADKADSRPSTMSGGERQRVAIARALAPAPSLLLCDEPTGNLDSANSEAILELFTELNWRGITIILITHDERVARLGNRSLVIKDGVMTESVHVVSPRGDGVR